MEGYIKYIYLSAYFDGVWDWNTVSNKTWQSITQSDLCEAADLVGKYTMINSKSLHDGFPWMGDR